MPEHRTAVASLWLRLTEPHPAVEALATRRRTRLAAGLLVVFVPMAALYTGYYVAGLEGGEAPGVGFTLATAVLVLFTLAYLLVRSRNPLAGIWLVVLAPWTVLNVAWFSSLATPSPQMVYYSVIPVVVAGLLIDLRAAAAFALANLVVVTGLLVYAEDAALERSVMALLFLLTLSALAIVSSGLLGRSIRQQEATNEELRHAQEERTQLLHVIAHDLASPLSPIQLRLDLLRRATQDEKHLPVIQRNFDHIQRLIEDVKDLARIQGGRLSVDKRRVQLDELVRRAQEGFEVTAKERGITAELDVRDAPAIEADPDRLNQVLYNLLTNAIKFSPDGATIQIRAWREGHQARVEVEDHGRGLTEAEIARLFQPFSQVHKREEVKEKGTGLGLFISKGIIEAHGGHIWAESPGHGKGATFGFVVPVAA